MAQTPISASVLYNSTTPSTIYTVPATKTAVVKGVLASSLTSTYDTVTVSKVSGGVTYPLVRNQVTGYAGASSGTQYYTPTPGQATLNLLESPITLAAGDSISISTTGTSYYKMEYAVENSNYRIGNIAYLNGNYIVVGINNLTGTGLILTSTDGITYTQRTFSASVYLTNVVYGNGYYVVCNATGGTIHYSTDLVTWTQVSLSTTFPCFALVYGGGKFVTGGGSGASYYATTTPLSWTAATVFNSSNTINSIAYIGTNYFYATTGISYYTADFTTYTQPYVALLSGTTLSAIAASNNKILATNNLLAAAAPNTFLRSSADGVSWSAVTTIANAISNYVSYPVYAANGGYFVTRTNNNTGTAQYLSSSDGVTWALNTFGHLTGYNQAGTTHFSAAYFNTANTSYNNRVLVFQYAANNNYIQGTNIATNGVMSNQNFSFAATMYTNGTYQGYPLFVGNPYDGSWRAFGYYSNGGNNGGPFYYGSSPTTGVESDRNQGWAQGQGIEYGNCIGVLPNSPRYICGTSSGWIMSSTGFSAGWSAIMGSPSYGPTPTGFTWQGVPVAGMARGGELSTSPFVIIWTNGYFATTTDQASTWTFGNIGISSIPGQTSTIQPPIQYGNGYFYVVNTAGAVARSANGITWEIMINNINNIYYLNSQNIFLSNTGQTFTSATGVVDVFTSKSTNGSFAGNPSTNQMIYLNSTYYVIDNGSVLYQSSDLITWTNKAFNSTPINNVTYLSTSSYSGMTYSGTGNAFVLATARAAASSASTGGVGKLFTPSINTYVGNATASIVQID